MSDKPQPSETMTVFPVTFTRALASDDGLSVLFEALDGEQKIRSEERRVGKECS